MGTFVSGMGRERVDEPVVGTVASTNAAIYSEDSSRA